MPCFGAVQRLYGRRFKNADFWETLAKAREAVRLPYTCALCPFTSYSAKRLTR